MVVVDMNIHKSVLIKLPYLHIYMFTHAVLDIRLSVVELKLKVIYLVSSLQALRITKKTPLDYPSKSWICTILGFTGK